MLTTVQETPKALPFDNPVTEEYRMLFRRVFL